MRLVKIPIGFKIDNARGIIPNPVNAERIDKTERGDYLTSIRVYTVPSGKILFLYASHCCFTCGANSGKCSLQVCDQNDNIKYHLHSCDFTQGTDKIELDSGQYCPALELSAGWYVLATVETQYQYTRGTIHGWLENA
ncbi:hypothetical protein ES705_28212 [subsurface metagenome]